MASEVNFGWSPRGAVSGLGGGSVLGQIVVNVLKPLVSKFVDNKKELFAHENIVSYPCLRCVAC